MTELDKTIRTKIDIFCNTEQDEKEREYLANYIKQLIKDTCEKVVFESFKSSTSQANGDKAKYWTDEGYYDVSAESKYYPQDWYDKSFKPNLDKILKKELGDE